MSSFLSQELEQHFLVIKEQNPTTGMRTIVLASQQQTEQIENQLKILQTTPTVQEKTLATVDGVEQEGTVARVVSTTPKRIVVRDEIADIVPAIETISLSKPMQGEFEMSMMGELKYFLHLQIKQQKDEILIH